MAFRVTNKGGDAGFKFFHEDEAFDPGPGEETLVTGPFTIYPLEFYLQKNESLDVYVRFQPVIEGQNAANVILACDNQTSQFYQINGYGAMVDVTVDKIDSQILDWANNPINAIFFPDTYPNGTISRQIQITNSSELQIHYSISPEKGAIPAKSSELFYFNFTPSAPQPFNEYTDFFIEDIPVQALRNKSQGLSQLEAGPSFIASNSLYPAIPLIQFSLHGSGSKSIVQFDPKIIIIPNNLQLGEYFRSKVKLINLSSGPVNFSIEEIKEVQQDNFQVNVLPKQGSIEGSQTLIVDLEILSRILGQNKTVLQCNVVDGLPQFLQIHTNIVGPCVRLAENVVDLELIRCYEVAKFRLTVENLSPVITSVLFKLKKFQDLNFQNIENYEQNCPIKINPQMTDLDPFEKKEIEISYQTSECITINEIIECMVENGQSEFIKLIGEVQKPQVFCTATFVELGEIYANKAIEYNQIKLVNDGNLPAQFQWEEITRQDDLIVQFEPCRDIIQPKTTKVITMIMTPFKNGILEELFSCDVDGMDFPIGFSVQAKVKGLQVHYEPVDAPVEVSKRTGIQEKESEVMKKKKTQTPSQQSQHGISASQIDSRQPSRQMSGFQQFTSTSMKAEESYLYESKVEIKTIDFGGVNIHQPKTLKFKIKNISGISTEFLFSMEKYEPIIHEDQFLEKQRLKEEELNRLQAATSTTNKRGKLNKTGNTLLQKTTGQKSKQNEKNEQIPLLLTEDFEEKNKFHSAMGEAFNQQNKLQKDQKFYLKNNLGLAIVCEPYRGKLLPKSEIVIKITCYNDSCGNFHDMLISRVKGLKTVKIPVSVKVTGSPLCVAPNQAGIFYKTIPPTINLGDLLVDAPSMQKILKLYNSGPQQIEVDWKLYNQNDINILKEEYFNVEIIPTNYATMMVENKQIPLDVDLMEFKLNPVEPPESHEPYQISPSQGVVQGRSTQSFKISFTSPIEGEHKGVLVAYPRMKMENGQYQQLGEISVLIIAKTQSPKLTIDKVKHEDGEYHLQFEAYAYQSPPPLRQFSLVNETSSVLKFNMEITEGPFEIITTKVRKSSQNQKEDPDPYIEGSSLTDPNEKLNVIQTTQGVKKNVLVPGDSIIVKIKLKIPSINNFEEWPDLIRVQKDGILQISYPNGTNQKIILEGSLYRPRIKLFSEQVDEYGELKVQDFGVLNTTQYKIIKIFMENTTNVPANWQLNYVEYPQKAFFGHRTMTKKEIEDTRKIDDQSVFIFEQSSGILEGPTIPLRQTPQGPALPSKIKNDDILPICIKARFQVFINIQPKQDKLYKSLYRITVEGGRNYDFVLRGYGSYKEEHDHIPLV